MDAFTRRINILFILSRRRYETISTLAHECQVSFNTICHDISLLSMKFPIETRQGNGGGVYVVDDWYFGDKYLNPDQEQFLLSLLENHSGRELEILKSILSDFSDPKKQSGD